MFNSQIPSQAELPSTAQLIRSTVVAMAGAALLLVTIVLPAEYGLDPTGIGGKLGLTAMAHVDTPTDLTVSVNPVSGDWQDDVSVTIPGYGQAELKLTMQQGETADFEWQTDGTPLSVDLHGDGAGDKFISYFIADATSKGTGVLTAEFSGTHGWYWQNKSKRSVVVTLRTKGTYSELKRVM